MVTANQAQPDQGRRSLDLLVDGLRYRAASLHLAEPASAARWAPSAAISLPGQPSRSREAAGLTVGTLIEGREREEDGIRRTAL
jgi:hypothetical protein